MVYNAEDQEILGTQKTLTDHVSFLDFKRPKCVLYNSDKVKHLTRVRDI